MYKFCLSTALVLASLCACAQENTTLSLPSTWKTECIGDYQISLPGEVDFALSNIDKLMPKNSGFISDFVFSDGSGLGNLSFNDNLITRETDQATYQKYVDLTISSWKKSNDKAIAKGDKKHLLNFPAPRKIEPNLLASIGTSGATLEIYRDNRIYSIGEADDTNTLSGQQVANSLFSRFSTRKAYTLPYGPGVCLPYAFIKRQSTSRAKEHNYSVAVRLLNHPDVEIFFKDVNAEYEDSKISTQFKGSRGQVQFFWSYYGPTMGNQLQGTMKQYHAVKLGEFNGEYAFATIARPKSKNEERFREGEDEAAFKARVNQEIAKGVHPLDYGFMAYYKGNPDKKNEPDLMLYVIRTASRAIAVGKQPVSEEELKTMALQIAASVQRRKTN